MGLWWRLLRSCIVEDVGYVGYDDGMHIWDLV